VIDLMRFTLVALALAFTACSSNDDGGTDASQPTGPNPAPPGEPWNTLGEWKLFADVEAQRPVDAVVPYDVISVLYADEARKERFVWIPDGETIGYSDTERWNLPVGTILVKTFWFPNDARDPGAGRRLLETRLLLHDPDGWTGLTYVYRDTQNEATLLKTGDTVHVDWTDESGTMVNEDYNVPNVFDCQSCHGTKPDTHPLGPRTRQLDRDNAYGKDLENQIDHFAALGWLDQTPPQSRLHLTDPYGSGAIVERARSYLDANCAHCHAEDGKAKSTGLWLAYEMTDPATGDPSNWGVCKFPTSAGQAAGGLSYDIVPGDPDASIMPYRTASTDPAVKMPPLLTRRADARGVQVIRDWIAAMPAQSCDQPAP
jgi:uncharacterized repeat protein (TIGR03806 family)